jgi:hypothetical protein
MATAVQEKELKQQGAFEAAANPESNVTAADAEKLAIAESKKAGVAAYVFDPDASTKDKQRQAKSVSAPADPAEHHMLSHPGNY